jgi:hypothetical protein
VPERRGSYALAVLALARTAAAEPTPPHEIDHTAAEAEGAPSPGDESGRTDPVDGGDSALRVVGRGALFVPKLVVDAVLFPARGAVWLTDRYHLSDLYTRTFYTEDRRISFVPVGSYVTGYGLAGGVRFVDRDTFGEHERGEVDATIGASYRSVVAARIDSGGRFDDLRLGLDGAYERLPEEPFFAIGNDTEIDDPGHYKLRAARIAATADVRAISAFHVIGRAELADIGTWQASEDPLADPAILESTRHGIGELELRWDTRGHATAWEPRTSRTAGTLAAVFAGRVLRLDHGHDFTHYGAELQHYVEVGRGPRWIALRLYGEGVSGNYADVPFFELPVLGGDFLRNYAYDRFRDRIAAYGSIQYQWDLSHYFDAYLFADAGRVYSSLDALTLEHLRLGYGVGLELHTGEDFIVAASIGSTSDGGIAVIASLNPLATRRPVWR